MDNINYKDFLKSVYNTVKMTRDINLEKKFSKYIDVIADNVSNQKAVYTVLITLLVYKHFHEEQDIRYHQSKMEGGFSGRSFDTKYITPTLKELSLPSMVESGWLTRSLEQSNPYDSNYSGSISGNGVKEAFLSIINFVENKQIDSLNVLKYLLLKVIIKTSF